MAGGTWKIQNKRRPGAYINVVGNGQKHVNAALGRVLMIRDTGFGWGPTSVIELNKGTDFDKLGLDLDSPDLIAVREALKGASTVLLMNPNAGKKAEIKGKENMPWDFTAKYPGTKGNTITVSLELNPNTTDTATVSTLFGTKLVDQVSVKLDGLDQFKGNKFVDAVRNSNTLTAFTNVSAQLAGGTDEKVTDFETQMNEALENETYAVATTAGFEPSNNLHSLLVESIKRLREKEGRKVRGVIPTNGLTPVDYEGISQVVNGYELANGEKVDVKDAAGRFAGLSASADAGTALTYTDIDDAIAAYPKLDNDKTIVALNAGQIVFTTRPGQRVVIEQDINSLVTFTPKKPEVFSKNRVVRTLDEIATDTQETFEESFLGKVGNAAEGRDLFKANRMNYLAELQKENIIQNFSNSDITVEKGEDSDSIVVNLAITPVDAMEKLYMTMIVR